MRVLISLAAIVVLIVRVLVPSFVVDNTTLALLAIAILPWLSSIIGKVTLPGGFAIEFRERKQDASKDTQRTESNVPEKANEEIKPNRDVGVTPHVGSYSRTESSVPEVVRGKPIRDVDLTPHGDSYTDRLLKYTPVESIAAFVFLNAIVGALSLSTETLSIVRWAVFIVLLVSTLFYLQRLGAKSTQLFISALGFAAWTYALGGPFALLSGYQPIYGALALMVYVFVTPIIEPS